MVPRPSKGSGDNVVFETALDKGADLVHEAIPYNPATVQNAEAFLNHVNNYGYEGELKLPPELFEKEKPKKLNQAQINRGIERLNSKHPLIETPFTKVFPMLGSFKKCCCVCKKKGLEKEPVKETPIQMGLRHQISFR